MRKILPFEKFKTGTKHRPENRPLWRGRVPRLCYDVLSTYQSGLVMVGYCVTKKVSGVYHG